MVSSSSRRRAAALLIATVIAAAPANAKVFSTQQEALALAFPDADRQDSQTVIPSEAQVAAIEARAGARLQTEILKLHRAWRGEQFLGYAVIDVHTVRSRSEALMVVLTPAGVVRSLRVLAFYEPLEYKPVKRWFEQFEGLPSDAPIRVGRDIHGVIGATLSSRAVAQSVRRVLAIYDVLVRGAGGPPE